MSLLYNIFLRFIRPYFKFKKHFASISPQFYEDERLAVFGLWTVNPSRIEEGKVNPAEIIALEEKFRRVSENKTKILAFHHPLTDMNERRVQAALERIRLLKPQIMMWGHDHQSGARYWESSQETGAVLIAAGTSVSNRTRTETNSFNIIELVDDEIKVETIHFDPLQRIFESSKSQSFSNSRTRL